MSDEREKKSWREIDQARIRGIKTERTISKADQREQKLASSLAKKQLESLFSGSKLSKDKAQKIEEIKSLRGKPAFYEKLTEYYKAFGTPLEWDAQIFFLDHKDTGILIEILSSLLKTAPLEPLQRQETLASKLKVMELTVFDSKLIEKIQELKKALLK